MLAQPFGAGTLLGAFATLALQPGCVLPLHGSVGVACSAERGGDYALRPVLELGTHIDMVESEQGPLPAVPEITLAGRAVAGESPFILFLRATALATSMCGDAPCADGLRIGGELASVVDATQPMIAPSLGAIAAIAGGHTWAMPADGHQPFVYGELSGGLTLAVGISALGPWFVLAATVRTPMLSAVGKDDIPDKM